MVETWADEVPRKGKQRPHSIYHSMLSVLTSLAAANIANAATIPPHLSGNFERYYRCIIAACHLKAGALPRPRQNSRRLYFRVSPVFVCDFEDSSRHDCCITIGSEGDRFHPQAFQYPCNRAPEEYFVIVFTFLKRDGVLTDALAGCRFDDTVRDFSAENVQTTFSRNDDTQFMATRELPQRERACIDTSWGYKFPDPQKLAWFVSGLSEKSSCAVAATWSITVDSDVRKRTGKGIKNLVAVCNCL